MKKLMSPEGIVQENGSILRIENGFSNIKLEGDVLPNLTYLDKRSLQIAIGLKQTHDKRSVELISKMLLYVSKQNHWELKLLM